MQQALGLNLLAPELSLCLLALVVIILDLLITDKRVIAGVAAVGLVVPAAIAISYWGAPTSVGFGGALIVDSFAIFFKLIFLGAAFLVILASADYVAKLRGRVGEYYALILISCGGMMLMAATRELISIYIALETTSIPMYALASFLKDDKSSEAGLKYLLLGAIASATLLYGMALLFGLTGTTDLGFIAVNMGWATLVNYPTVLLAMVLVIAGFGFKIAAFPFQMWVPDVYEGAPTPITAYLSVASKAAGFAVILRVLYTALGTPPELLDWGGLIAILAAFSMTLGNLVAIAQTNIKRMFGYSSIAQAGYIMVGLATLTPAGRASVLFFLVSYTLTNLAAFIAIIALTEKVKSDLIADLAGMARRSPFLALGLAFALISLTGVPPAAGFFAKLYIFKSAVDFGLTWLVIVGVINSVVSAYYYWRVLRVMYTGEAAAEQPAASPVVGVALLLSAIGVLVIGILPAPFMALANLAGVPFP